MTSAIRPESIVVVADMDYLPGRECCNDFIGVFHPLFKSALPALVRAGFGRWIVFRTTQSQVSALILIAKHRAGRKLPKVHYLTLEIDNDLRKVIAVLDEISCD